MSELAITDLSELASKINDLESQINGATKEIDEISRFEDSLIVRQCRLVIKARDHHSTQSNFNKWGKANLSVEKRMLQRYCRIGKGKASPTTLSLPNSIQFMTLELLSKENMSKSIRDTVIRRFDKAEKDKTECPTVKEITDYLKEKGIIGTKKTKSEPSLPLFEKRLDEAMSDGDIGLSYLLGTQKGLPVEEVKKYAKVWMQELHPDKGGDAYAFVAFKEILTAYVEKYKNV